MEWIKEAYSCRKEFKARIHTRILTLKKIYCLVNFSARCFLPSRGTAMRTYEITEYMGAAVVGARDGLGNRPPFGILHKYGLISA